MIRVKSSLQARIGTFVIAIAVMGGCSKREASLTLSSPAAAVPATLPAAQSPSVTGQAGEPKQVVASRSLVYTVHTTIRVDEVRGAILALRSLVSKHGGYFSQGSSLENEGERRGEFEARIPSQNLTGFRAELSGLGEIGSDTEQVEDVTEQRADLEARIGNARVHEKRLLELLANKAGQLNEIVAVEKEISNARENIERMEAQQRGLAGRIQFATVRVSLEPKAISASQNPGSRMVQAGTNGVRVAFNVVLGIGILTLNAGPTLLVLGLGGFGFVMLIRRLMRRKLPKANPEMTS